MMGREVTPVPLCIVYRLSTVREDDRILVVGGQDRSKRHVREACECFRPVCRARRAHRLILDGGQGDSHGPRKWRPPQLRSVVKASDAYSVDFAELPHAMSGAVRIDEEAGHVG
jgi:hypothetical protein